MTLISLIVNAFSNLAFNPNVLHPLPMLLCFPLVFSISVVPTSLDSPSPLPSCLSPWHELQWPRSPCPQALACRLSHFRQPGRIHLASTPTQQRVAESQLCASDEQRSWFRVMWWGTVHGGARHTVLFTTVSPVPRMCWIERRVHTLLLGDCCVYVLHCCSYL